MSDFKRGQPVQAVVQGRIQGCTNAQTFCFPKTSVAEGANIYVSEHSVVFGRDVEPSGLMGTHNIIVGLDADYEGGSNVLIGHKVSGKGTSVAIGLEATAGTKECVIGGPHIRQFVLGQPGQMNLTEIENPEDLDLLGVPIGGLYVRPGSDAVFIRR